MCIQQAADYSRTSKEPDRHIKSPSPSPSLPLSLSSLHRKYFLVVSVMDAILDATLLIYMELGTGTRRTQTGALLWLGRISNLELSVLWFVTCS